MQTVWRQEAVMAGLRRSYAEPVGESDNAAPAVSAHHPAASVRIVELHPEIRQVCQGYIQDHQPIRPELPAQLPDALRLAEFVHLLPAAVHHDEIIPRTGHFMYFHVGHLSNCISMIS